MKASRISIFLQVVFWILLFLFQISMSSNFLAMPAVIIFASINLIFGMTVYYLNTAWLFPKYFSKKTYLKYILFNILIISALSLIFFHVDAIIVSKYRISEPAKHFGPIFHFIRAFTGLSFIYIISLIFSLIRKVFEQEQVEIKLSEEKLNTEIRLLKAQISPHFIFNALNNIYSLSYSESKQAPEAILKLSQMLRYVFYECNKDEVNLGSEIEYIQNFIGFQQMKSPHIQCINFKTEGVDETFRIAPMLLIPFVENSFKYSKIEDNKEVCVDIEISTSNEELSFNIKNDYPEQTANPGSGMGIENVKNRLLLTYPEIHTFDVKDENNTFEVTIKIRKA